MSKEMLVKKANKHFYDTIAGDYECIDLRRSPTTLSWLRKKIKKISLQTNNARILDLGCGNGFVSRAAKDLFNSVYGIDISYNVILPITSQTKNVAENGIRKFTVAIATAVPNRALKSRMIR